MEEYANLSGTPSHHDCSQGGQGRGAVGPWGSVSGLSEILSCLGRFPHDPQPNPNTDPEFTKLNLNFSQYPYPLLQTHAAHSRLPQQHPARQVAGES